MIAVTGLGIISALGAGVEATFDALLTERSGIGRITHLQTEHSEIPCAEVKASDAELRAMLGIGPQEPITRTALLGMAAAREAIADAGIVPRPGLRIGFINGTTVGGMEKSEMYYLDFLETGLHSEYISQHDCAACTERIAEGAGHFSFVTTLSTACSSAANAVILGADMLKAGLLDVAVVGGSECLTRFHLNGFRSLMILDPLPCRPFDATRAGLNLGEGAAYIVLEREEFRVQRGRESLCHVSGYGNACDAFHQTASSEDGRGAILAMRQALAMAGLEPSQIGYINAHGTGTVNNDASEGAAIATVFAGNYPLISSTKSLTGHTTSAAGGVEAVISILALTRGVTPGNANLGRPMEELPFIPLKHRLEGVAMRHVLSNSFGFGGNNSSLVFSL